MFMLEHNWKELLFLKDEPMIRSYEYENYVWKITSCYFAGSTNKNLLNSSIQIIKNDKQTNKSMSKPVINMYIDV